MKRYAFFSDVHGNYFALKTVLEQIATMEVDQIFCLGDILFNHGTTDIVIDLLDKYQVFLIRGNHDEPITDQSDRITFKHRDWAVQIDKWLADNTSVENRERLANLPVTQELTLENGETLLMFHAHPDDLWARINSFEAPMDALEHRFGPLPANILVYGHFHKPHVMRLNGKLLVNVASVDSHTNVIPDTLTRFTVLESYPDRNVIQQYTLPYDIEAQEKLDSESNLPPYFITKNGG